MYSLVGGPQSSWGKTSNEVADQSHAAAWSVTTRPWTPTLGLSALQAEATARLLHLVPPHSFLSPAAGEPLSCPSPTYKKGWQGL